jgi:hypothetical protein
MAVLPIVGEFYHLALSCLDALNYRVCGSERNRLIGLTRGLPLTLGAAPYAECCIHVTHGPALFELIPGEIFSLVVEPSICVDIVGPIMHFIPVVVFKIPGQCICYQVHLTFNKCDVKVEAC